MEIGILIGAIVAGLIAFSVYATLFSNPRTAGGGFFEKYLRKEGINPEDIPLALRDEIVDITVATADLALGTSEGHRPARMRWNQVFEQQLSTQASMLAAYLRNPTDFRDTMVSYGTDPNATVALYRRHGL